MLKEGRFGFILKTTVLSELFDRLHIPCQDHRIILGISDDSRCIQKDWLFVARQGARTHGTIFIQEVLAKGAVVLCDMDLPHPNVYQCEHVEYLVQALIELYYGDVCSRLCIIGVTGTNGKTSVSSILTQLLILYGKRVLRIGTHEIDYPDHQEQSENTTPGCFALANYFRDALKYDISHIVMEVSSHAIDQNRIGFIHFDMIIYTNITQDHLDYHLTKTQYRYTKFKLRRYLKPQGAIVYNNDLTYMDELINLAHHTCISIGTKQAHFTLENIQIYDQGSSFQLQGYEFISPLLGMVNVYNVGEALIICRRLGMSYECIQKLVPRLHPIEGRLDVISNQPYHIWLDYAHTPDAIKTLLEFAVSVKHQRVIIVFGCGGNREHEKRIMMANLARQYADISIFTTDNPRFERASDILSEMCHSTGNDFIVIENRYYAIKHAVKIAQKDDIIIIAGKGNEDTQEVLGVKYPFSDRCCVIERLMKEEPSWN